VKCWGTVPDAVFGIGRGAEYDPPMSRLIALLLLAVALPACSSDEIGKPRRVPAGHNGDFTTWWSDTQRREVGEYREGERHGEIRIYYPDGSPKERATYVDGVPDGNRHMYHPGGVVAVAESVSEGKLDGERREFDLNGQLVSLQTWDVGQRSGPQLTWHANGSQSAEGKWKDDLPSGRWRRWDDEGRLLSEEWFWSADGRPVGTLETVIGVGGVVTAQGLKTWRGGHWHGWRTFWHDNGVQAGLVDYLDDERTGRDLSWSDTGLPLIEGQRDGGRRVGIWKTYDERGRLVRTRDHDVIEPAADADDAEDDAP